MTRALSETRRIRRLLLASFLALLVVTLTFAWSDRRALAERVFVWTGFSQFHLSPVSWLITREAAAFDFEGPELPSDLAQRKSARGMLELVPDPVDPGNQVFRAQLTGHESSDPPDNYRAELNDDFSLPFHRSYWFGFRMYVPEGFRGTIPDRDDRLNPVAFNRLGQWHASPDKTMGEIGRVPPISQHLENGEFSIRVAHSAEVIQFENDGERIVIYSDPDFETGRWHDFVYKIRCSFESDGIVRVLLNGAQIVNYGGPNCYNDRSGLYFKLGAYRAEDYPENFVVLWDDYRRGPTRADVDQDYADLMSE